MRAGAGTTHGDLRTAAALVAWVVLLFGQTLGHGFYYDDAHSIVDNERLRDLHQIPSYFVDPGAFSAMPEARMYRPLLLSTYAVNFAVGGEHPRGFHLVNVILHALAAMLLWRLGQRLLPAAAVAVALLFAAHPLVTEPVNYISSRSSSLTAVFLLAALLSLVAPARRWQGAWLTLSTLGAVLTKATGIVIAPIAAAYLLLLAGRRPWRLLLGPGLVIAAYVLGTRGIIGRALGDPVRSMATQLATQVKTLPFYLRSVAMPVDLSIDPQFREAAIAAEPAVLLAAGLGVSLLWMIWLLRRHEPLASWGATWFLLALAPTFVVPLNVLANEHRLYLGLPGIGLCLGALLRPALAPRRGFLVVLALLLAVLSLQRNQVWQDEGRIWKAAIQRGPRMPRPYVNLGKWYLTQGRYEEAIETTQQALEIDPDLARGHYNIATSFMHLGRYEQAIASFRRTLELEPTMMEALNNLGNTYKELGRFADAVDCYRRALAVVDHPSIYHNLGSTFLDAAAYDSSVVYFRRALQGAPDERATYVGLARALRRADRLSEAIQTLTTALRRWPQDASLLALLAHSQAGLGRDDEALSTYRRTGKPEQEIRLQLGQVAEERGDWRRAAAHYEAGLAAAPRDAALHNALGEARLVAGDRDGALNLFRQAARLDSSLSVAYRNIGLVYLQHGRYLDALAALRRAIRLEEGGGRAGTWELLARVQAGRGDLDAATAAYERAIEGAPQRASLYHNLASLYERRGAPAQAERLYREALARDPHLIEARNSLGYLLLAAGRYEAAAVQLEAVVAARPEDAGAHVNLAGAYLHLGRRAAAIAAYERALQLYPAGDATRERIARQLRSLREG